MKQQTFSDSSTLDKSGRNREEVDSMARCVTNIEGSCKQPIPYYTTMRREQSIQDHFASWQKVPNKRMITVGATAWLIILTVVILLGMMRMATAEVSSEALEITDIKASRNGSVKIRWTDPLNNAPYQVLFQPVTSANEEAPTGEMFVWCNSGDVNKTEYTEMYVVPDASWWFIVEDSAGNQTVQKYEAKDSKFDGSWGFKISGRSQSVTRGNAVFEYDETNNDYSDMPVLKLEDIIAAADNVAYGVRLSFECTDSSLFGDYLLKYTMTALGPAADNSPIVVDFTEDTSEPLVFNKDYTEVDYFVNLSPYLKRLNSAYGDVKCTYVLKVYFDGEFVAEVPVQVQ